MVHLSSYLLIPHDVFKIYQFGPRRDGIMSAVKYSRHFSQSLTMCRGLGGKQADRRKDRFRYRQCRRRGRWGEGKIQRGWKKSDKKVERQTWGQIEEIRWAGTRQDTAEGLVGRHGRAFHLLRSYVKDISSSCVRVCMCVSIDVLYLVWMCSLLCLCSDVCLYVLLSRVCIHMLICAVRREYVYTRCQAYYVLKEQLH